MGKHDNHRQRLDKKVRELGFEMIEPHERLEHLLYAVIPRGDTNGLAHRLIERFGNIPGVLNATPEELQEIDGIGVSAARFLSSLMPLLGVVQRELEQGTTPVQLDTTEKMARYARSFFNGKVDEAAYIFCLNTSFRLMDVLKISDGVGGEAFVFPVKTVRRVILSKASAIAIAHNHPCGELKPSTSDILLSRKLKRIFTDLDIQFCDSIVVSGNKYYSMSENGYLNNIHEEYK